jgi:hypothetical protein
MMLKVSFASSRYRLEPLTVVLVADFSVALAVKEEEDEARVVLVAARARGSALKTKVLDIVM